MVSSLKHAASSFYIIHAREYISSSSLLLIVSSNQIIVWIKNCHSITTVHSDCFVCLFSWQNVPTRHIHSFDTVFGGHTKTVQFLSSSTPTYIFYRFTKFITMRILFCFKLQLLYIVREGNMSYLPSKHFTLLISYQLPFIFIFPRFYSARKMLRGTPSGLRHVGYTRTQSQSVD